MALAQDSLRRVKYRQSMSAGWTNKVASWQAPVTAEHTATGGRSAGEEPATMPEAVELLRELLTAAAFERPVVIGIDELDKIGSIEDAQHFLNDIKAIFGVPGCYFLISVSEDAVASFERRGMPLRDAFDSAFDDILRVELFELDGTESLLARRTVGMPMPFMAVSHILSGGLARDTIRIARRLFDPPEPVSRPTMAELCHTVVTSELAAKRDGAVTAVREVAAQTDVSEILSWLGTAPVEPDLSALEAHLPLPTQPSGDSDPQASLAAGRLLQEFAAYWYFAATIVEFFSAGPSKDELRTGENASDARGFEQLARARQAFTIEATLDGNGSRRSARHGSSRHSIARPARLRSTAPSCARPLSRGLRRSGPARLRPSGGRPREREKSDRARYAPVRGVAS